MTFKTEYFTTNAFNCLFTGIIKFNAIIAINPGAELIIAIVGYEHLTYFLKIFIQPFDPLLSSQFKQTYNCLHE